MKCFMCGSKAHIHQYMKNGTIRYRCPNNKCDVVTFNNRKNTIMYRMRINDRDAYEIIYLFCTGYPISQMAHMKGYAESNVRNFLKKTVKQFHKFESYKFLESSYTPEVIEVDEIWVNIQGEEVFFGWIAYDPKNKVIIDFILGKRDKETLEKLFKKLSVYRTKIKLCLIDGYKGYEDLIRKYLGRTRNKPLTGVINKSKWSKKTNSFVTYGLFGKSRKNVEDIIKELGLGEKITTALIERINRDLRDCSAYLKRRTPRLARLREWVDISLKGIKFFHNATKAHGTLSFKSSKNWISIPITPFMEAGILDYIVDIKEFLFTPHT